MEYKFTKMKPFRIFMQEVICPQIFPIKKEELKQIARGCKKIDKEREYCFEIASIEPEIPFYSPKPNRI